MAATIDEVELDQIMRRVALGDESAFADLYDRLVPSVYRLVRLVLGSGAEADADAVAVVRATFVELWTSAVDPRSSTGLPTQTWALAVAHRTAARSTGRPVAQATEGV